VVVVLLVSALGKLRGLPMMCVRGERVALM
jgi:hypothetical protein